MDPTSSDGRPATPDEPAHAGATNLPADLPTYVVDYLSRVPGDRVQALLDLREAILSAVPEPVEERASYGIITVNHAGGVVGFGATDKHCALYVMDTALVARLKPELGGYAASGGTIRFQPDSPLPTELVARIVSERVAANQERAQARAQSRRKPAG